MLPTSRTVTTNPFAERCFTHLVQHWHCGSLYTVMTDGGDAASNAWRPATSAPAASAEERSQSRREIISRKGEDRFIHVSRMHDPSAGCSPRASPSLAPEATYSFDSRHHGRIPTDKTRSPRSVRPAAWRARRRFGGLAV